MHHASHLWNRVIFFQALPGGGLGLLVVHLIYGIVWLLARNALLPDGETRGIQTLSPQPYNLNPESWTRRQDISR